jgi:hypothetical protein
MVGKCPAETGSRKVPLLVARQQGRAAKFVAVLCPYKGKFDLVIERRGDELTLRHGGSSEVLTLPEDDTKPTVARGK